MVDFEQFFKRATNGNPPCPYQKRLATESQTLPSLLDVPTGLGKTAAALLAWLWRRRFHPETAVRDQTPRRLVYCLPMRVLVEQTYRATTEWLGNLSLWAEAEQESPVWIKSDGDHGTYPIAVHLLLGGEEKTDWALWPERDAILIGTQDMLLSRAMNRGYAAGRARWPLEFGFLNSDCLWVFDEIQIMDTGLASSLQFDAWRQSLRLRPERDQFAREKKNHISRPCHSLWMSATMAKHWLERAVDWSPKASPAWDNRHELQPEDFQNDRVKGLFANRKSLEKTPVATLTVPKGKDSKPDVAGYLDKLVPEILKRKSADGLTLVIVNTVDRAVGIFRRLKANSEDTELFLIHSRFRPMERERWADFLSRKDGKPRIVISTQVVEAGVDLSAKVLFTELAPWASLVQRFGRCARFIFLGGNGKVVNDNGTIYWMDTADNERAVLPYSVEELGAARSILLRQSLDDVGLQALKDLRPQLVSQAATLFPYEPRFVPRDKDLFDLFDTTPDLTGADVDISRFIRDGEELDIQAFWRELQSGDTPQKKDRPHRRELCSVPFHRFRELLPALRKAGRIWRRNYCKGWEEIDLRSSEQVYPGQVFMLEKSCGGYDRELGWTGLPTDHDFDLPTPIEPTKATAQDDEDEADDLSQINAWLTVEEHTSDVCRKLDELLASSGLTESEIKVLRLAARFHDWGKAHKAFQAKLLAASVADEKVQQKLNKQPAAKAPDFAWRKDKIRRPQNDQPDGRRPGFRHELASALAILEALYRTKPDHPSFMWPDGLDKANFGDVPNAATSSDLACDPLMQELVALPADELDLLVYLVAAHHGKVRMSLRSSPDDSHDNVPDPCPNDKRQARGVRDDDLLPICQIPAADLETTNETPAVALSLDFMELGLSPRYGASWRERTQLLLDRLGPFQLGYLEALLRAADCRASAEEYERGRGSN
jgi:CRISPR-associated endonuclease/helicase Cas3